MIGISFNPSKRICVEILIRILLIKTISIGLEVFKHGKYLSLKIVDSFFFNFKSLLYLFVLVIWKYQPPIDGINWLILHRMRKN